MLCHTARDLTMYMFKIWVLSFGDVAKDLCLKSIQLETSLCIRVWTSLQQETWCRVFGALLSKWINQVLSQLRPSLPNPVYLRTRTGPALQSYLHDSFGWPQSDSSLFPTIDLAVISLHQIPWQFLQRGHKKLFSGELYLLELSLCCVSSHCDIGLIHL